MDECRDPKFGNMLHAYELGMLSDEDRKSLEMHLMECEYCFQKVVNLKEAAALLNEDVDVKNIIAAVVKRKASARPVYLRIWNLLWPESPRFVLAKPLAVIALLLIIAYPVYKLALQTGEKGPLRQTLNLYPLRGERNLLTLGDAREVVINFVYEEAEPSRSYEIRMVSQEGEEIYFDGAYTGFTSSGMGAITLPASKFSRGRYSLIITDISKEPPEIEQEYYFRVE